METNDKKTLRHYTENELPTTESIDKNDDKSLRIYSGNEDKMINLIVEIIVKIIKKEIL